MRKYLFPALFVCLFPLLAGQAQAVVEVHEVAYSSATVTAVSLSTSGAEQVDVTSLNGRFSAEIFNDSTATTIYCSFSISVSSTPPTITTDSPYYGREIAPGAAWTVAVNSTIPLYCICEAATEPVVTVTQLK